VTLIEDIPTLIAPGIGNSGPEHWQTLWERNHPRWRRVAQRDWDRPTCKDWVQAMETAVADCSAPPVVLGHSIGCLVVAHWAAQSKRTIRGAVLVAVPDPSAASFPAAAEGFGPVPLAPFRFPSLIIASDDDAFGSVEHARRCADGWGSGFRNIGPAGHINAESGHGPWPEGLTLFQEFLGHLL
jgi:predicted alpha/beta hydrolase family esterase